MKMLRHAALLCGWRSLVGSQLSHFQGHLASFYCPLLHLRGSNALVSHPEPNKP